MFEARGAHAMPCKKDVAVVRTMSRYLCLTEIRSEHIHDAIRRGPGAKEIFLTYVYRQLKRGRSGDEVRPGCRVN